MRVRRSLAVAIMCMVSVVGAAHPARAGAAGCGRIVIFAFPGVTWELVERERPTNLMRAVELGATGSVSVRTNASRTTHASGFATIGAGTRVDVPPGAAQPFGHQSGGVGPLQIPDAEDIDELAAEQGYTLARPGALGAAISGVGITGTGGAVAIGNADLGFDPPAPAGFARYATLAAMDAGGHVSAAATGPDLLEADAEWPFEVRADHAALTRVLDDTLAAPCVVAVVDPGDLVRAGAAIVRGDADLDAFERALTATDEVLGEVMEHLGPSDLLLIVAPSSPQHEEEVHFGIALAIGAPFEAGEALTSPTTRRAGLVTLPDLAPTILERLDIGRPSSMLGRAWFGEAVAGDRVADAVELDREAVFIDGIRTPVTTGFVLFQLVVYAAAIWVLAHRRERPTHSTFMMRALEGAALSLAAFPIATYLLGLLQGNKLGTGPYVGALIGVTLVIVVVTSVIARAPLDRLLVVVGATFTLLTADLILGASLQLNTVLSYSPIVAGRFAGIGNIGFAILAATSVLTAALIVHRWGATRRTLACIGGIFVITVVVDGAPQFGSDVGGAIALVPGLGITWLLLAGKRPTLKSAVLVVTAAAAVLAGFLAMDLSRPEESRTHLARLYEDVRDGGAQVFGDAIFRKVRTNLRVLGSTIWTFVVPPALALLTWLLLRPRWRWLAETYPKVHAGLIAGLIVSVLGYAVNDSGIVIPAMMFAYLVPVAVAPLSELPSGRGTER